MATAIAGHFLAQQDAGRRVIRFHLGADVAADLKGLLG
jgi:hypothetical protein